MTTHKIVLSIMMLIVFSTSAPAFSGASGQPGSSLIEGSYIVTFKENTDGGAPLIQPPNRANRGKTPFGESSTGQSRSELAATLGLTGQVVSIFETINAAHVKMDAKEAERLSWDKRVLRVDQNVIGALPTTQVNPGWGLDRLDSSTPTLNNAYNYSNAGAGQTIVILDSGLALSNPSVAAEFGGRASIVWDRNVGGTGNDCIGHGTEVASIAGGNTFGVAKGVTLLEAKVTFDCTENVDVAAVIASLNWLAANAPKGTIALPEVELSLGAGNCSGFSYTPLDNAVVAAHNAGVIVIVPAGNDGCNTANYSPVSVPQAFVVGATNTQGFPVGQDRKADFSRVGWNISAFAPGDDYVRAMNQFGWTTGVRGTSFSAPYIAGIFAVACQAVSPYCSYGDTAAVYAAMRNTATLNTVTNTNGTPLTGAYSRFIRQQW